MTCLSRTMGAPARPLGTAGTRRAGSPPTGSSLAMPPTAAASTCSTPPSAQLPTATAQASAAHHHPPVHPPAHRELLPAIHRGKQRWRCTRAGRQQQRGRHVVAHQCRCSLLVALQLAGGAAMCGQPCGEGLRCACGRAAVDQQGWHSGSSTWQRLRSPLYCMPREAAHLGYRDLPHHCSTRSGTRQHPVITPPPPPPATHLVQRHQQGAGKALQVGPCCPGGVYVLAGIAHACHGLKEGGHVGPVGPRLGGGCLAGGCSRGTGKVRCSQKAAMWGQ